MPLDDYWRKGSYMHAWDRMSVAALNISGWWDMNFPGAPLNFEAPRHQRSARRSGPPSTAATSTRSYATSSGRPRLAR